MEAAASTTIGKANAILEALTGFGRSASLKELAELLPFPKPTVRRILLQLMGAGMVEQDEGDRRYRLGRRLISLAAGVIDQIEPRRISIPVLHDLMTKTGESTYLAIRDGKSVIYIDVVEGAQLVNLTTKVGTRHAAHSTGTGKVLLAFLPRNERRALLAEVLASLAEPRRLLRQLAAIRSSGVAVVSDERNSGISSVAAPVFDGRGRCVAALAVGVPSYRFAERREGNLVEEVVRASGAFSRLLGEGAEGVTAARVAEAPADGPVYPALPMS